MNTVIEKDMRKFELDRQQAVLCPVCGSILALEMWCDPYEESTNGDSSYSVLYRCYDCGSLLVSPDEVAYSCVTA